MVIGHSKRALLPFIGDIWKGLATQDDLEVLVQHINAAINRVASALAKHGGDLSSYILQLDHRVEQMMTGIKHNHMVTKLINAKLNNESRAIQDRFSTMLSLYAQQLDQSYTVNHHLDKISAAIADLVTQVNCLLCLHQMYKDFMLYANHHTIIINMVALL